MLRRPLEFTLIASLIVVTPLVELSSGVRYNAVYRHGAVVSQFEILLHEDCCRCTLRVHAAVLVLLPVQRDLEAGFFVDRHAVLMDRNQSEA